MTVSRVALGTINSTTLVDTYTVAGSGLRSVSFNPNDWLLGGAGPPTQVNIGTTPTIRIVRYAVNTTGFASRYLPMPSDWDTAANVTFTVLARLTNGQINNDSLDLVMDYVTVRQLVTGQGLEKTSTQITASRAVTTGEGLAAGDVYPVVFSPNKDDATNPYNIAGARGFGVELRLANTTGVTQFGFLGLRVDYGAL